MAAGNEGAGSYDTADTAVLEELQHGITPQRPWQVLVEGHGNDPYPPMDVAAGLGRILDLCPSVSAIEVRTANGRAMLTRDFRLGSRDVADSILARTFRDNPAVTSVRIVRATGERSRVATPDDPYVHPWTKPVAELNAAREAGQINEQEYLERLGAVFGPDVAEDRPAGDSERADAPAAPSSGTE